MDFNIQNSSDMPERDAQKLTSAVVKTYLAEVECEKQNRGALTVCLEEDGSVRIIADGIEACCYQSKEFSCGYEDFPEKCFCGNVYYCAKVAGNSKIDMDILELAIYQCIYKGTVNYKKDDVPIAYFKENNTVWVYVDNGKNKVVCSVHKVEGTNGLMGFVNGDLCMCIATKERHGEI